MIIDSQEVEEVLKYIGILELVQSTGAEWTDATTIGFPHNKNRSWFFINKHHGENYDEWCISRMNTFINITKANQDEIKKVLARALSKELKYNQKLITNTINHVQQMIKDQVEDYILLKNMENK